MIRLTMKHETVATDLPSAHADRSATGEFLAQMSAQYDGLSKQLKLIASYVEKHQDQLGLERIQDVAERCGVQP